MDLAYLAVIILSFTIVYVFYSGEKSCIKMEEFVTGGAIGPRCWMLNIQLCTCVK